MDVLEAAKESAAVLAHHAQAAGLAQLAFRHILAAGQEALRISAVSETVVHFKLALQFVQEGVLPEMPNESDLRELYTLQNQGYQLSGQMDKASVMAAERDKLG